MRSIPFRVTFKPVVRMVDGLLLTDAHYDVEATTVGQARAKAVRLLRDDGITGYALSSAKELVG